MDRRREKRREKEWREARRAVSSPNQKERCYDEKKKRRGKQTTAKLGQNCFEAATAQE